MRESPTPPASPRPRHIWVHDSTGHPFQVQLSRALARRGHRVTHSHLSEFQSPKGPLARRPGDPAGLRLLAVERGRSFPKYDIAQRVIAELRYADLLLEHMNADRPDVLLSSNMSTLMASRVSAACARQGIGYVHWLQDVYFRAVRAALGRRSKALGALAGAAIATLERRIWRRSRHVVAIAKDFVPDLEEAGLPGQQVSVVPNWAPFDDWPEMGRQNGWRSKHGLGDDFLFLYTGTLGYKHNPGLLLALARRFPEAAVVVVSEGMGADWLAERQRELSLPNLRLLPYQPYSEVAAMMASADALVVLLEASAGAYSVPSKALSYHCAGRPLLVSAPSSNLAARIVSDYETGLACEAGDEAAFLAAAARLREDGALREVLGKQARNYAEQHFDIDHIADRFEAILVRPEANKPDPTFS